MGEMTDRGGTHNRAIPKNTQPHTLNTLTLAHGQKTNDNNNTNKTTTNNNSHAIVSSAVGPEYYVSIMSFVDKAQLEPGCSVLLHNKAMSVVGILADETDPMVSVMKVDKAPTESYADVGGLEQQITEIKEAVELPLTHPELYEDIGIKPPKVS